MTAAQAQAASDLLYEHWREGRQMTALPAELRPLTRADGYAIQACLERRSTQPRFGWKIAATSQDGQRHINVDGPLAGRLLAERVVGDGAALSLAGNHMRVAEPEFAFRFARDVAARGAAYAPDEVLAAVGALHLAIEVPNSRFEAFAAVGAPQLIADDACAHDFVLGPAAPARWREIDLAQHPVIATVAGMLERHGSGANVLGDPRLALTWLVNELCALGISLRAGEVVTTGTCAAPLPIRPGDAVQADFGALGRMGVRFTP